jgi:hypothetical protein
MHAVCVRTHRWDGVGRSYAAIKRVFEEIMRVDPSWRARTVLDWGSGPGTAILAHAALEYAQDSHGGANANGMQGGADGESAKPAGSSESPSRCGKALPRLGSPLPHTATGWAHPGHICIVTGPTSSLPHWLIPRHICAGTGVSPPHRTGTGLTPATSAPGLGSPAAISEKGLPARAKACSMSRSRRRQR